MKVLIPIFLCLAGCANEAGFDARMQPLVGRSVDVLVQTVGVPDNEFTTPEGRRFLQYDGLGSQQSSITPAIGIGIGGIGLGGGGGGLGLGLGTGFPAYAPTCRATFEIRADRVAGFSRSGSGCVA